MTINTNKYISNSSEPHLDKQQREGSMIIKCISNKSNKGALILPIKNIDQSQDDAYAISSEWHTLNSEVSGYNISIDSKYFVAGIINWNNEVRYLISDDNGIPGFFPAELFQIYNSFIMFDWEINIFNIKQKQLLVIGYTQLAHDYNHLIGLVDMKSDDVKIFLNNKHKE